MPTVALHSHYWAQKDGDQGTPPDVGTSADGGYVPWQTSVIVGGGFGVTQVVWEWLVERAKEPRGDR